MTSIFKLGDIYTSNKVGGSPSAIKGLLRRGQVMALSAPRKSLKTSLATQLTLTVARGGNWIGWDCHKLRVLFVNINHTENDCLLRFSHQLHALEIEEQEKLDVDILTVGKGGTLRELIDHLTENMGGYPLIILDGLDYLTFERAELNPLLHQLTEKLKCCLVVTTSHQQRPRGNGEAQQAAKWSEALGYSDTLLEFFELQLHPELLRRERLEAVWPLSKKILETHAKNYYLMNIKGEYPTKASSTSEELREHLAIALRELPEETLTGLLNQFDRIDLPLKYRTYWRLEVVTANQPPEDGENHLFYYPTLKQDEEKILIFHEPGIELDEKYLETFSPFDEDKAEEVTKQLSKRLEQFVEKFDRYPNKKEFADFCKISRPTLDKKLKLAGENLLYTDTEVRFV